MAKSTSQTQTEEPAEEDVAGTDRVANALWALPETEQALAMAETDYDKLAKMLQLPRGDIDASARVSAAVITQMQSAPSLANPKMLQLTKKNFEQAIAAPPLPLLVDFYANWCQPCKLQGQVLDELQEAFLGKLAIAQLNTDEQPEIASRFDILGIPTLIVFARGQITQRSSGYLAKRALKKFLNDATTPTGPQLSA